MADDDKTSTSAIPLLTDDNYPEWLIDMKALLRAKDLWEYTQVPLKKGEEDIKIKKGHEKAADMMTPRISGPVKRKLVTADFDDGCQMLSHLRELFAPATEANSLRLLQELLVLRPATGSWDSVETYLLKVKTLSEQIDATNIQLTADRRTILVLTMGLADTPFNSLTQVWSAMGNVTAYKAVSMVREEIRKLQVAGEPTSAFYTGGSSSKKPVCGKCKKEGHKATDCWKDKTCDTCGRQGHISKFCRKKDKDKEDESEGDPIRFKEKGTWGAT